MAELTVTSSFVSAIADGTDATVVRPSNWNAGMTASSGQLTPVRGGTGADTSASSGIAHIAGGTWTVSAVVEADLTLADNTTANVSTTAHGFAPKITDTTKFLKGDGTWATPSGGTSLDGITAAAANQAGILNADFNIVWKWAPTTDSTIKLSITESAAATGGTVTSGIANQALVRFSTLAASTASPFQVYVRGAFAFGASSTTAQLFGATGSNSAPSFAFAGAPASGFYWVGAGSTFKAVTGTTDAVQFDGTNGTQFFSQIKPNSNGAVALGQGGVGWKGLYLDYTNTATVGNVTIDKPSGRVNLAAAGTQLTLTNSLITAASHVFLNSDGAPGNVVAVQFYAVPAAGSCTINAVPAVTNQTAIDFVVVNAD